MKSLPSKNARELTLIALRDIAKGKFADVVVNRLLEEVTLIPRERSLFTELVYGIVRRQRLLMAIIDRLATQPASKQPPNLSLILQIGLYQLHYLDRIPPSAVVNTSVELAKQNGLTGLSGVVNGILRQYLRWQKEGKELSFLPTDPMEKLGILYSFPDWLIDHWIEELGIEETEQLCQAYDRTPSIDLRVNTLTTDRDTVLTALQNANISVKPIEHLPQGLRLQGAIGAIDRLPGYLDAWWTVQDASAQLVTHLLDPQPGETIIDACAAPGGKTTHIAELMADRGEIIALDKVASRLKKLHQNIERLGLGSIQILTGDSREFNHLINTADRVLLDAPCSGLGTLHRRADARWQKTPEQIQDLAKLQAELLANAATWVKPGGVLVYATCTVHPLENAHIILPFLAQHPDWQIEFPAPDSYLHTLTDERGWIRVWLHRHQMDGFFMVKLRRFPSRDSVCVALV
jgi:16S rRNA (cytosine967-C5)-methyltransferase